MRRKQRQARVPVAYGYGRASTEDQEVTVTAQTVAIEGVFKAKYELQGFRWGGVYFDRGVSGGVPLASRPEGRRMCVLLEPGDVVIIHKLDRGWRNAADFCSTIDAWQRMNIRVVLLDLDVDTGTIIGRALAQILAVVAQLERGFISERMKAFHRAKRLRGEKPPGHDAYGTRTLRKGGKKQVVPCEAERELGRKILAYFKDGWSGFQIYQHLRDQKVVNPRTGRPFLPTTLYFWAKREQKAQAIEMQAKQP